MSQPVILLFLVTQNVIQSSKREVSVFRKSLSPGCQRPPIKRKTLDASTAPEPEVKEANTFMIKVGKPAPDFTAAAFHKGIFVNVSLSELKGKWVILCFYPGDFTFV